jgi:hypothetical protein
MGSSARNMPHYPLTSEPSRITVNNICTYSAKTLQIWTTLTGPNPEGEQIK